MVANTISKNPLAPEDLRPFLQECGYHQASLVNHYHFGTDDGERTVALAAFAHQPTDVRSACVAVIDVHGDPMKAVASYRQLGAPVVFVCREEQLQWWQQGRIREIIDYCTMDVRLTRNLFRYGCEKGYLIFRNRHQKRIRIPVDWNTHRFKK